jgi:hypothetical protein
MKTFSLIYSETSKQVWALILVPIALTAIYLFCLEGFGYDVIPFWLSVGLFLAAVIFTMLWVMNKVVNVRAKVTVSEEKLVFELHHTNFLYHTSNFEVPLENIENLTEDVNTQNDYRTYFNIKTRKPSKTIFIMQPRSVDDKQISDLSAMLHTYIERYNHKPGILPALRIREGSFYDAKWALVLTYLVYASIAIVTIALFSGWKIEWYKALQVYGVGAAWLMAYHTNTRRKVKA